MTSENDGEPLSSPESGCPSPVLVVATGSATTTAGKGILVHCNSKKTSNTNRVSFVTNSSSASSTSTRRSNNNNNRKYNAGRQRPQKDDEHSSYYARTGRQLTGFGIKSYLHNFYDDPENRVDLFQGDDFNYCVEPEIRWRRHCGGVCAAFGLAIMAMGAAAMAVGHLMPARDPVVGRSANMEVIDRWAVTYNENLALCRYVGSVAFAVGVVFTVVRFWISVMRGVSGDEDDERAAAERKLGCGDQRPSSVKHHHLHHQQPQTVRIPITGSVENVQPDPRVINLQYSDNS